jgi:murein DD-endopeptidase MepM/ murein hydrolase activator NlpD
VIHWQAELNKALAALAGTLSRHPRALTGSIVGVLGGFAVAAFGVAPFAPDAQDLPRYTISEPVALQGLEEQLEALADHSLQLIRNDQTRSSDTADSLLKRMGAFDAAAAQFLREDALARRVLQGRSGKLVQLSADAAGRVGSIVVRFPAEQADQQSTHFSRLSIQRDVAGKFSAKLESAPLTPQVLLGSGSIQTSLFAATDEARIPDAVASQMADIFSGDIDFHRELRKGDRFSVVFETMTADGETATWSQSSGRVLAAEFVNNGRTHTAVWFREASGKGGYYGFDGQNKRRAFLASPMEFSRVTSGFAMRFHPILQRWQAHMGVDYGAPTGTPVRSVGEGTVEFAGWQNGFGNVVYIRHAGERQTLYAHLSRIDVKKGQRIDQGQRIGAVGATGWATGPHLHFEFRVKGRHQDPRIIARASEAIPLPAAAKGQFMQTVASVKSQLTVAESIGSGVSGAD